MADLIDREEAYFTLTEYYHHTAEAQHRALREALDRIPGTEIIHCKDCKHHIDGRCLVANHHTVDHECCAEVFGAKRKEDAKNCVDM